MNDGEVREINGNLCRFVEYTTCENIENAVRKNGNLSNMSKNACIPIIIYDQRHQRRHSTYINRCNVRLVNSECSSTNSEM